MVKAAVRNLCHVLTASDPQTFLGANWIPPVLRGAPARFREPLALRLLSLSPHYFYPDGAGMAAVRMEHKRLRHSRRRLAELVVRRHSDPSSIVLDFGCGPGYLAREVACFTREVVAADISRGALACARVVNPAPNARYVLAGDGLPLADASIDLVCSFAVIQHVSEPQLKQTLREFARVLRPGGTVLCHVPVDKPGWAVEDEWRADTSFRGRLKLRYALNCFGRTKRQVCVAIREAGFDEPEVRLIGDFGDVADPDLQGQELFMFHGAAGQYEER